MSITTTDLQAAIPADEYLQLTDRTHVPPTTTDATIVAAAIEAAEGRANMYLARRYALPLNYADPLILAFMRRILVDYAWLALHPRADMASKELTARCEAHDETLKEIRDGEADLPSSSPPAATSAESKITASSQGRKFGGLP
jgi:phage gp36-like protein